MLEGILTNVDPVTGRALGTYFSRLGAMLLGIATTQDWESEAERKRRARVHRARNADTAIEEHLAAGLSLEAAIDAVAAKLDADPAMIAAHWKVASRRGKRLSKRLRNVEIMRLAALGWDPARIGAQVGLSKAGVERVIRMMIRAGKDIEGLAQRFARLRAAPKPPANTDDQQDPAEAGQPALKTGS